MFIVLGAISAALLGVRDETARGFLVLATPGVMAPLILLMLKEHAYLDLRNRYLAAVLRPRAIELAGEGDDKETSGLPGWYDWEQEVVRRSGVVSALYGMFGLAEYVLPVMLSIAAVVTFPLLVKSPTETQQILWWCDVVLASAVCVVVAAFRLFVPHLPRRFSVPGKKIVVPEHDA